MNAWAFKLRPIADIIRRKTPTRLGWGALASIPGLALAGPTGENVVAGGAVISRPSVLQTQVDQSTARAVVNWSTFSVDSDEYVVFNQPGATASILNRVVGSNQSQIFGQIEANGRVFLVNPQGVYFAPGARVDVAGLTASVMDITDNNFMSGNYVFSRPANAPDGAGVENAGNINVSDGGFVVLAGDYANNSGIISARLGSVVLAAGSKMTLDLSNDGLVSFAVDEATVSSLAGANNTGQVLADGGQVIMTAKVANDLVATAVNNEGLLQAHRIVADGGEIYLAASGADVVQAGTIDVAGEGNQSGGEVGITGDADITLTADSRINADGSGAGNGGTVNVIADGTMAFRRDAEISARAGAEGDRGGSVELSGHEGIQVRGNLQLGKGGELVIDPAVVGLVASSGSYGGSYGSTIGVNFIEGQLNSSVDVSILASNAIVASSGVNSITAATGTGDLALRVTGGGGGGLIPYSIGSSGSGGTLSGSVSDGNIELAGVDFDILGDFTASAGINTGDVNLGSVTANNVRIYTGAVDGSITLNTGGIAAGSTILSLSAADDINIGTTMNPGNLSLVGGTVNVALNAGGDITVRGNLSAMASGNGGNASVSGFARNITMNNVMATAADGSVYVSFGAYLDSMGAGGDINLNNVTASANTFSTGDSYHASVYLWANNDINLQDVTVYGHGGADVYAGAGRDINGRDVTAEVMNAGAYGSQHALIDFFAERDITARNLKAKAGDTRGTAEVLVDAGGKIVIANAEADAPGSDSGSFGGSYGGSYGSFFGGAVVSLEAVTGVDAMNLHATANAGGAGVFVYTDGGNLRTAGLKAMSDNHWANVFLEANGPMSKITVGGNVEVSGTAAMFSAHAFDAALNGNVDIGATSYAWMDVDVANDLTINGDIVIDEAGGGILEVYLLGANNTTINGDVTLTGGTNSFVEIDIGAYEDSPGLPTNTVTLNGNLSVMSGMSAFGLIFGGNVNVPGNITIRGAGDIYAGDLAAGLEIWAVNNANLSGDVLVRNTVGDAGAQVLFGGNQATFGKFEVVGGGTDGWGVLLVNAEDPFGVTELPQGFVPGGSARFNMLTKASGGGGSLFRANVMNEFTTGPNGIIDSQYAEIGVWGDGTTLLDGRFRVMETHIMGPGDTPNVRYDNRAFAGPSAVNFGSGTVLKAAQFLATGPLTFNGPLTADNLAVGVTSGDVTFNGPVNITGAAPFLLTAPDLALFNLMGQFGLVPPSRGPNVQIFAQNGININDPFVVDGPSPFTKMFTNGPFNISGLTTNASNMLAVFSPIDTTRPIFFEDQPFFQPSGASAFFNFPTIQGLPDNGNVTVVIGEQGPAQPLLSGPLTIGSNGLIDIGDRNMFIITRGAVTGEDSVITNGIFQVVGLAQNDIFEVPVVNEFGEDTDSQEDDDEDEDEDDLILGDNGDDGDDDGDVAEEGSGSESMECS